MASNNSNYFSEHAFNKMISVGLLQSKIKILNLNIRSYFKNQSNFWNFLKDINHKFRIIALTETFTKLDNQDQLIYPGYNSFIKSRSNGIQGGVALLVDDS